ncbi:putative membrane protein [Haloplanus aerogenes]|nr:putative membrane protein [Haloplanus aerogenes]
MGGVGFGLGMGGWWLVLLLALLALGIVAAALYLRAHEGEGGEDGALTVLRERYAAGDLDEEEFERRRERLTGGTG